MVVEPLNFIPFSTTAPQLRTVLNCSKGDAWQLPAPGVGDGGEGGSESVIHELDENMLLR